ncbi:MAG: hypothetical protein JWM11_7056, partial [Planctomycetaceae bacterium]|nr:hypothetical protein [Planctomycetaceae bacterium]
SQLFKGEFLAYHNDPDAGPESIFSLHHRNYAANIGRFQSEDPAEDDLNLYRMVGNSPPNRVDPSGLEEPTPSFQTRSLYGFYSERFTTHWKFSARITSAMKTAEIKKRNLLSVVEKMGKSVETPMRLLKSVQSDVEQWTAEKGIWTKKSGPIGENGMPAEVSLTADEQQTRNASHIEAVGTSRLFAIYDDPASEFNKLRALADENYREYVKSLIDVERAFREYDAEVPLPHPAVQPLNSYFLKHFPPNIGGFQDQQSQDKLLQSGRQTASTASDTSGLRAHLEEDLTKAKEQTEKAELALGGAVSVIKGGIRGGIAFAVSLAAGKYIVGPVVRGIQDQYGISEEVVILGFQAWNLYGAYASDKSYRAGKGLDRRFPDDDLWASLKRLHADEIGEADFRKPKKKEKSEVVGDPKVVNSDGNLGTPVQNSLADYLANESTVLERPAVPRTAKDIDIEATRPEPPSAEVYVNGNPNILKGPGGSLAGRPGAGSGWQAGALRRDLKRAEEFGATDIRIRQTQVDASGTQVGINKPDLQYTVVLDGKPVRVYIEYDNLKPPSAYRGNSHYDRIKANDPQGIVILRGQ